VQIAASEIFWVSVTVALSDTFLMFSTNPFFTSTVPGTPKKQPTPCSHHLPCACYIGIACGSLCGPWGLEGVGGGGGRKRRGDGDVKNASLVVRAKRLNLFTRPNETTLQL